jgi:hypothetical protein
MNSFISKMITDKEGDWEEVCKVAKEELEQVSEVLSKGEVNMHCQGGFQMLAIGFSYGEDKRSHATSGTARRKRSWWRS